MEAAPLYDDVAEGPGGGEAWWLQTTDAERIRVGAWPAAKGVPAQGTILLFPGRTEYIEKYGQTAKGYTARGYAVLTLDWRGQGLTARAMPDPRLGHVVDFAEYQRDIAAATNLAHWLDLPEPWFLLAHSMGSCIGLRALHQGLSVKAAAFSAPMWGIHMDAWERPLAWVSALLAPLPGVGGRLTPRTSLDHTLLADPFEGNDLTTDREMWDFMRRQLDRRPNLTLGGPTLRWFRAALFETLRLRRLPPPALPAIAFIGGNERIVEPGPVRAKMHKWPGGRLEVFPGAEHEILMERPEIRARVLDLTTDLFQRSAAH